MPSSSTNVTVYLFTVLLYVALYVASPVTAVTSGVQPLNLYVYCAVAGLLGSAGATGVAPYSYSAEASTVVPSSSTNVTVYLFTVLLYVAVYVALPVTVATSGVQPANVYVYCAVAGLLGSAGATGVAPYSCSAEASTVVPSSSTNVTVYLFTVLLYVAVYVASPVTVVTSGVQPLKVYVYCAVAGLLGSAGGTGIASSFTCDCCKMVVPSSSTNVMVYLGRCMTVNVACVSAVQPCSLVTTYRKVCSPSPTVFARMNEVCVVAPSR